MELRRPPVAPDSAPFGAVRNLWPVAQVALLAAILMALGMLLWRGGQGAVGDDPERLRELASRLKAAGALDESAALMERYADSAEVDAETRAKIAYGLGQTYLERGRPERALRWFYDAEDLATGLGDSALREEIARKIVHSLERMGRPRAAQAALDSRVKLAPSDPVKRVDTDPVVAKVGGREILRSEIDRALDDVGPSASEPTPEQRAQFLRRFVADELIYQRAQKLEYDRDPDVTRALGRIGQQMVISKFVEKEILGGLEVAETDVENFFAANRQRYAQNAGGDEKAVTLADVRPAVERDYLQSKAQAAYQELIDRELESGGVELFPEQLSGD